MMTLAEYTHAVKTYLALDELDEYCQRFVASYHAGDIPALTAALNLHNALTAPAQPAKRD